MNVVVLGFSWPQLWVNSSQWVCNQVWGCRPGPRCLSGQRAVQEAPRQEDRQCLLLPHPKTAPDSPPCQQRSHETAGDITRLIPLGLLQRHPRRPPGVDTNATSTCTECRRPFRARSWPPIQHHNSSERPTLAAGQAPHHLQSRNSDAVIHQALHRRCPAYLADLVAFSSTDSHRQLRSTTTRAAAIQRTRTQFGRRAFSVCGPDVWNSLPPSVRTVDSNSSFRRALKTHIICSSLRLTINCFIFFIYFTICLTM